MAALYSALQTYMPEYLAILGLGVIGGFTIATVIHLIMWGIAQALSLIKKF